MERAQPLLLLIKFQNMYTCTVKKESLFSVDYIVTTIFKDGVVEKCTYEEVSKINKLQSQNHFILMKSMAEQKLQLLNTN
jgi:hypothetical protein